MAFAVTAGCCADASCIEVCPVNCIHPTPGEPDFGKTPTMYVDPSACIDCGACADACPVKAIGPAALMTGPAAIFPVANAEYFRDRAPYGPLPLDFPEVAARDRQLQVAVIGAGPAAYYTADMVLTKAGAEVTMFDKLPVPGGLLRYGVAPDHPSTKKLGDRFLGFLHNPRLHMMMGVEIGKDVTTTELARTFDAVIYAVGASAGKTLGIGGEDLPGSISATDFVAWYNGHPDAAVVPAGLDSPRAVLIGNGNVALDIARILLVNRDALATTDVADHAVAALRKSNVCEVVIAARRGPEYVAFMPGELHALRALAGADLVIAAGPGVAEAIELAAPGSATAALRGLPIIDVDYSAAPVPGRIVLQFSAVPEIIEGDEVVSGLRVGAAQGSVSISAGLVIRAVGYRGTALAGLPFDEQSCTVPNVAGRVTDGVGGPVRPGEYVVGWIKRGASGGIGTNRHDASETVASLLADSAAGTLPAPRASARKLRASLRKRLPTVVEREGVLNIDRRERSNGEAVGRPRIKFTTISDLVRASRR